jgi:leader peptidase (prepilin peptidase) / N-methyltransferase
MSQATLLMYQWLGQGTLLAFIFALGACTGSFLNVVAWRLPRGENIVTPPSACPRCGTRLKWFDNLPILGWIALRGKCRYCRAPIAARYLLMEILVAGLFAGLWILWGADERALSGIGVHLGAWRPEWADEGMGLMWPMFALALVLISALVVSTLIDAQTFTIPAVVPWIAMGAGLVAHPIHAWYVERAGGIGTAAHPWVIPAPEGGEAWVFTLAALGALGGLAASNVLLRLRIIPYSFTDFDEWEREAEAALEKAKAGSEPREDVPAGPSAESLGPVLLRTLVLTGPAVLGMFIGTMLFAPAGRGLTGLAVGGALGLVLGALLRSRLGTPSHADDETPVWANYPHARREVLKESLFVLPAALGLAGGAWVGLRAAGPFIEDPATGALVSTAAEPPLWLLALAASGMGAIVGGGVVWLVRILGSLAFGKEAMGLGDVHLMAGVGAVLGWVDPLLAFFIAPFFGIAWALAAPMLGRFVRLPSVLPYGPHLALATLLLLYAKPLEEWLLGVVLRTPVNLP